MGLKNLLVYGGSGALGKTLVDYFKARQWRVLSIDLIPNEKASHAIVIKRDETPGANLQTISSSLQSILGSDKLQAIFCVAGGWVGGNASDPDFANKVELSIRQSVESSVSAVQLATRFLDTSGLLVLTGAEAALRPTPGMLAYGMAKAAVHHLTKSLSSSDSGVCGKSLAILPVTLDTPMNRKSMPNAKFEDWTPVEHIADQLAQWLEHPNEVVSGGLYRISTKSGKTQFQITEMP